MGECVWVQDSDLPSDPKKKSYQTYSQICMAAVYIWVRTLGRFTTFDGLSEAVIFHMSRNTEVLPITVYAGPHPTN